MNCKKCGSLITENDQFCKNCGESVNSQPTNQGIQQVVGQTPANYVQQPMNMHQPVNNMQPMNMQQPMSNYNNIPVNMQPTNTMQQPTKSSGAGKYIAIGLAMVVIVAVAFIAGMAINNGESKQLSNGGKTEVAQQSRSNYKVNFEGFTLEIPDNLVYEEKNGTLLIENESGTWMASLIIKQANFAQLQANKGQLQATMQRVGYTSSAATEKKLGGVNFITLELSTSGQNALAAMAKVNSMNVFCITAYNQDNEFDYKLLETIAPIIKSATYTGNTTNNIANPPKVDFNNIAELAK